jgi:hypothetical protein
LSSFIQQEVFDVCQLQETKKKTSFEDHLIHNLWVHQGVDWVVQESTGLSGGMLIIWNSG